MAAVSEPRAALADGSRSAFAETSRSAFAAYQASSARAAHCSWGPLAEVPAPEPPASKPWPPPGASKEEVVELVQQLLVALCEAYEASAFQCELLGLEPLRREDVQRHSVELRDLTARVQAPIFERLGLPAPPEGVMVMGRAVALAQASDSTGRIGRLYTLLFDVLGLGSGPSPFAEVGALGARVVDEEQRVAIKAPTLQKSEKDWREQLDEQAFHVLREKGTENAGTGLYHDWYPEDGFFRCAGCQIPLYSADSKFPSSCGWPVFNKTFYSERGCHVAVLPDEDGSRLEIQCVRCASHLGHVSFHPDDPENSEEH